MTTRLNPHAAWCHDHAELLAPLRGEYVAISVARGIVAHASALSTVLATVELLPDEEQEEILIAHASML